MCVRGCVAGRCRRPVRARRGRRAARPEARCAALLHRHAARLRGGGQQAGAVPPGGARCGCQRRGSSALLLSGACAAVFRAPRIRVGWLGGRSKTALQTFFFPLRNLTVRRLWLHGDCCNVKRSTSLGTGRGLGPSLVAWLVGQFVRLNGRRCVQTFRWEVSASAEKSSSARPRQPARHLRFASDNTYCPYNAHDYIYVYTYSYM